MLHAQARTLLWGYFEPPSVSDTAFLCVGKGDASEASQLVHIACDTPEHAKDPPMIKQQALRLHLDYHRLTLFQALKPVDAFNQSLGFIEETITDGLFVSGPPLW
jgi:hypothetical protein